MKKCPKKEFIQIPNNLFEAISAAGLGKSQRKVVDLILRYTLGITRKTGVGKEHFYNTETAGLKQADIARILGFSSTHTRGVLEALREKGVILWEEEINQLSVNEDLPQRFGYKKPEHTEMLYKNIQKLKVEVSLLWNQKATETVIDKGSFRPLESHKKLPKYNKDILNTTKTNKEVDGVKVELLRFLGSLDSVRNPEAYLGKIIDQYGEAALKKLLKVEFRQWYEYLDYWKKEGK